jgi:hypothetical protein
MYLLDTRGCIIRTPQVARYLEHLVLAEEGITSVASQIELDAQQWGQSGLHFSALHEATGVPLLLKVNVARDQLWWTRLLAQHHPEQIPHIYASGERLGNETIGSVLWERVAGGLHPGWHGREFTMLLEAGVQFQLLARQHAADAAAAGVLHELRLTDLVRRLEAGIERAAPGPGATLLRRLEEDWAWVSAVCETALCHGDLHMANVLCREGPPGGQALLIDHHPTRMPWACEAARLEILNAEPARAGCRGLVAQEATIRARHGLSAPSGADLVRLQAITLGWYAIDIWAHVGPEPNPSWRDRAVWHAENAAYIATAAEA